MIHTYYVCICVTHAIVTGHPMLAAIAYAAPRPELPPPADAFPGPLPEESGGGAAGTLTTLRPPAGSRPNGFDQPCRGGGGDWS